MSSHSVSRRAGFTLIELLVSALILAIGLIALSQLYMAAMWTYQKSRCQTLATQTAQRELEKAEACGYDALHAGLTDTLYPRAEAGGEYSWLAAGNGVTFPVDGLLNGQGKVAWTHYGASSGTETRILQLEINITWGGTTSSDTSMKIVTLIAKQ